MTVAQVQGNNFQYYGTRISIGMIGIPLALGLIVQVAQQISSFALLPSQIIRNVTAIHNSKQAIENSDGNVKMIDIPIGENRLTGIFYSPNEGTDHSDSIILHHNPQLATIADYFVNGKLLPHTALGQIVKWFNLPMIFYDYRGAGLNSKGCTWKDVLLFATSQSLIEDGKAALTYALEHYKNVLIIGSSLGGGVGTISLNEYLKEHPSDAKRVWLINHDSFTTTSRVILPKFPNLADRVGAIIGAQLHSAEAMENLLGLQVPIAIFCHDQDPKIPLGARMADWVQALPISANHASLAICRDTQHTVHVSLDPSFIANCAKSTDSSSPSWLSKAREQLSKNLGIPFKPDQNEPFPAFSDIEDDDKESIIPLIQPKEDSTSEGPHSHSTGKVHDSNAGTSSSKSNKGVSLLPWIGFTLLAVIGVAKVGHRLSKISNQHSSQRKNRDNAHDSLVDFFSHHFGRHLTKTSPINGRYGVQKNKNSCSQATRMMV